MELTSVPCYGVHTDPQTGVRWGLQAKRRDNVVGLPSTMCPFLPPRTLACPHDLLLSTSGASEVPRGFNNPLASRLVPQLRGYQERPLFILLDREDDALQLINLQRTLIPTTRANSHIDRGIPAALYYADRMCNNTNLGHFLLWGISAENAHKLINLRTQTIGFSSPMIYAGTQLPAYMRHQFNVYKASASELEEVSSLSDEDMLALSSYAFYKTLEP